MCAVASRGIKGGTEFAKILKKIGLNADAPALKIGVLGGATYFDGTPVAVNAARHEFGTATIPERSFLRSTSKKMNKQWAHDIARVITGKTTQANIVNNAFEIVGGNAAQDVQQTITNRIAPPLKASTVDAKARSGKQEPDIPLVDTGTLQEAISYEVVLKKGVR